MSTAFLYGSRVAGDHGEFHQKQCGYCPRLLPAGSKRTYCSDCTFMLKGRDKPEFTYGPDCAAPHLTVSTAYNNHRCRCSQRCKPWHEARLADRRNEYAARRG